MSKTNDKEQKKGLKRNIIDKFYTKKEVVEICMDAVKTKLNIDKDDLVIEPSAGNGSFISEIKKITDEYKFYDIDPANDEVIKQDYLAFSYKEIYEKI